jgi:hypothetical protein
MDELTLLRNFHRDTPGPSAAETAAARARLLEAIDDPQSRGSHLSASRRRQAVLTVLGRRRLWAPVAAAAAVTAVALTAAAIAAPGPHGARPSSPSGSPTAASVLRKAAAAAARQPPGHGRYFATESELIVMYGYPASGALRNRWIGNGLGGRLAWLVGPVGERLMTWAQFQRLPTAPDQLQAAIARVSSYLGPGIPPAATEFSLIANLLASAPGSPALRSALYQVAARLPGLALVPHARDLIGRAAAEVYMPVENAAIPGGNALYFNPSTGAALDVAEPAQSSQCPDIFQEAVLASGYVGSNHQLPAGAVRTARPVPQLSMFPACGVKPTVLPTPAATSASARVSVPSPTPAPPSPSASLSVSIAVLTPTPAPSLTGGLLPSPTGGPLPSPTPVPSPAAGGS